MRSVWYRSPKDFDYWPRTDAVSYTHLDVYKRQDYSKRKGMSVAEIERWLGQNLNYDPAE